MKKSKSKEIKAVKDGKTVKNKTAVKTVKTV